MQVHVEHVCQRNMGEIWENYVRVQSRTLYIHDRIYMIDYMIDYIIDYINLLTCNLMSQ